MNFAKAALCLLLPLLVTAAGSGEVRGQQSVRPTTQYRTVPRDTETMVAAPVFVRQRQVGYCTAADIPALDLVTPPKHGTVRFVITEVGAPKRLGCSNPVYGRGVLYRPEPGFVGEDQFTYYRPPEPMAFNSVGPPPGPRTVIVTVR